MVTVIGMPIALVVLALYPLMLLLGYLATAFLIGRQTAAAMKQAEPLSFGRRMLFLALALIVLGVIGWIPFVGCIVSFAALVAGIGGWAVWLHRQYTTAPA
jgi:hypothetical protein